MLWLVMLSCPMVSKMRINLLRRQKQILSGKLLFNLLSWFSNEPFLIKTRVWNPYTSSSRMGSPESSCIIFDELVSSGIRRPPEWAARAGQILHNLRFWKILHKLIWFQTQGKLVHYFRWACLIGNKASSWIGNPERPILPWALLLQKLAQVHPEPATQEARA